MAIFHLTAKIIGRSSGKSAVAAAAYRSGTEIYSEHQDMVFDYSKKQDVFFSEIITPDHVPDWMKDREKLWNGVELYENRKDATYAREIEVALPVELTFPQQKELLREYIEHNFVRLGMVADYSIHSIKSKNPHAHIMLTMRDVVGDTFGKKVREWNDKKLLLTWREEWSALTNKHLALAGMDKRVSHLSYADQGIDLEPTLHRGHALKNNVILERYQKLKAIEERNYHRFLKNPDIVIDLLTHHESVFSHHDLAKFLNERTRSVDEFNQLKFAVEASKQLVNLGIGHDGKTYYTSKKVLKQESDLIERAQRLSQSNVHQLDHRNFDFVVSQRTLTEEQQAAFNNILSGQDLSLLVGFAGTGKSYLMDAVREAYEAAGYTVVGTTLSGKAADGLTKSALIDTRTIARFMIDWDNDRQRLTDKTVLIIDEAGMVGSRQFQALLQEAERVGAKVIACGDPEQLPPVEAGGVFRYLLERIQHVFLKNVIRQEEEWQRQATVELSTQQHAKAIDRYHEKGHIYAHTTREEALNSIVKRWYDYRKQNPDQSTMMMSFRNIDVLSMNLMARDRLVAEKILEPSVTKIETATFGELDFSIGERIIFLRNEKSIQVKNGLMGEIEVIDGKVLSIKLDRGDTITFDAAHYNDLGYGYASTIHKLQGDSIDKTFVLATPNFDRFVTNVALDRHKKAVELHYGNDDFKSYDNLKRTMSRGESKVLAVEFAKARGIDYELDKDEAAQVESKTDFKNYYREVITGSTEVKSTIAEVYLKNNGIKNVNDKVVRFNPRVWNRETQSFMPALIAKALGKGENGYETKGVQVTYLTKDGKKAALQKPIRYAGSKDVIIMLQKPSKKDQRWYLTSDLETGLGIAQANPNIRVATLATDKVDNVPLRGEGRELIYYLNHEMKTLVKKIISVFSAKGFKVSLARSQSNKHNASNRNLIKNVTKIANGKEQDIEL